MDGSLPLKAPPPWRAIAAVGVDDDLAAGEAGVAHRAADLEAPGRVDQQLVVGDVEAEWRQLRLHDVFADVGGEQGVEVDVSGVLRADDDGVEPDGLAVLVADGHLGLAVGTQVTDQALLADRGEAAGEAVGQRDRQRHQLGGLVAGEAEHQALVAGALAVEVVDRVLRYGTRRRRRRPGGCRWTGRRWRR